MKFSMFLTVLIFAATPVLAADKHAPDAKMAEMMKKMMEAGAPGSQHKVLADMAGEWTYTNKMWMSPKDKPQTSKGTSSMKMILGGRWLQQEVKGEAMGQPYEGMGLTGYDNVKGKFDSLWLDNFNTAVMHGTGTFDEKTKILTDNGTQSCPISESKTRDFRSEWKLKDKDSMTYSFFSTPPEGGKEFKQMEIVYKRVK